MLCPNSEVCAADDSGIGRQIEIKDSGDEAFAATGAGSGFGAPLMSLRRP
jgi:hypothetical protein